MLGNIGFVRALGGGKVVGGDDGIGQNTFSVQGELGGRKCDRSSLSIREDPAAGRRASARMESVPVKRHDRGPLRVEPFLFHDAGGAAGPQGSLGMNGGVGGGCGGSGSPSWELAVAPRTISGAREEVGGSCTAPLGHTATHSSALMNSSKNIKNITDQHQGKTTHTCTAPAPLPSD